MAKVTVIDPDFAYGLADYLRKQVLASAFFSTPFPVGNTTKNWDIQYPIVNGGIFGPRWYEAIAVTDLPYVGIAPGINGGVDAVTGFCNTGFTLIAYDYIDPKTHDNDFEFNMACARGAIEKIYTDHAAAGIQNAYTVIIPTTTDVRSAVATNYEFRTTPAFNGASHFIKIDAVIQFGQVDLYNPTMP